MSAALLRAAFAPPSLLRSRSASALSPQRIGLQCGFLKVHSNGFQLGKATKRLPDSTEQANVFSLRPDHPAEILERSLETFQRGGNIFARLGYVAHQNECARGLVLSELLSTLGDVCLVVEQILRDPSKGLQPEACPWVGLCQIALLPRRWSHERRLESSLVTRLELATS